MKTQKTKYVITKKCFVGDIGDKLEVNWDAMDGAGWDNLTQNTSGNPFVETDCVKEVDNFDEMDNFERMEGMVNVRKQLKELLVDGFNKDDILKHCEQILNEEVQ